MSELQTPVQTDEWVLAGQISADAPLRTIRVHHSPFRVGRRRDLPLCIPSSTVSNEHAEFIVDDNRLMLRDLSSTNGTFVNGVRIKGDWSLNCGDLVQFASAVFRVTLETRKAKQETALNNASEDAMALVQFDRLMTERAVVPYIQPIVQMQTKEVLGYEVLGRSRMFGLADPKAMFNAAALLNLETDLSRMFRWEGLANLHGCNDRPNIFLNTHPKELTEPELLMTSLRELREAYPEIPITLEIHEAAVTDPESMLQLRGLLDDLNMQLAYDDYGAGQARLSELVDVPPDYMKFDLALIRDIQHATEKRLRMLESLVHMARVLGVSPLAEGIETEQDHEICSQLGFEFGQGYLYGKPLPISKYFSPSGEAHV